jgi:hypothetical protein
LDTGFINDVCILDMQRLGAMLDISSNKSPFIEKIVSSIYYFLVISMREYSALSCDIYERLPIVTFEV